MKSAVVGIGTIGPVHLDALTRLGEEIAALCDIRPERAVAAAERFHLSCPIFTDYEEMLDQVRPDIVHICTPHFCHADMIVAALTRGISVLCEKPLCIKESDIGRILAAEAASPAKLGVCHQNRINPANLFARRLFSENRVTAAHGSVVWHRDAAYYGQDAWRGKWKTEGGGVLINQALHTLASGFSECPRAFRPVWPIFLCRRLLKWKTRRFSGAAAGRILLSRPQSARRAICRCRLRRGWPTDERWWSYRTPSLWPVRLRFLRKKSKRRANAVTETDTFA